MNISVVDILKKEVPIKVTVRVVWDSKLQERNAKLKTSVAVVARAIRKNGYKQAQGTFVTKKNGKVVEACAVGQGALNLKCDPGALLSALNKVKNAQGIGLGDEIIAWNDQSHWPLSKIADRIEKDWTDSLGQKVVV